MWIFFVGQGRTRICGEAYSKYAAAGNPRRTQPSEKKTIYGWTLEVVSKPSIRFKVKAD
jgi:hypothetical protein